MYYSYHEKKFEQIYTRLPEIGKFNVQETRIKKLARFQPSYTTPEITQINAPKDSPVTPLLESSIQRKNIPDLGA